MSFRYLLNLFMDGANELRVDSRDGIELVGHLIHGLEGLIAYVVHAGAEHSYVRLAPFLELRHLEHVDSIVLETSMIVP